MVFVLVFTIGGGGGHLIEKIHQCDAAAPTVFEFAELFLAAILVRNHKKIDLVIDCKNLPAM